MPLKKTGVNSARTTMTARASLFSLLGLVAWLPTAVQCNQGPLPKAITVSDYSGPMKEWGVKGDILEAKLWVDAGDTNVLVISEIQRGETFDKNYVSALFGYRLARKAGKWARIWEIQEQNQSSVDIVRYDSSSLRLIDVDGNGKAETLFFYHIAFDSGTEPLVQKMIFHWNGMKVPIRGKIPRTVDDSGAYEMKLDPKLKAAPDAVREFAVEEWKRHIKANFVGVVDNP